MQYTQQDKANALETSLTHLASCMGYTPKRVGSCYTLAEMDSIRIYNDRTWYRWSNTGTRIGGILTYSVVNEKYGASFSIHTDKNDIWDKIQNKKMEAGEIDKLVKRLSDEAAFYNWNKKITEALNTDELLDIKYEFLEAENLSKSASQRIGDALDNREKEFAQSQTEKSFQFTDEPESKKSTKNKIEDFGKKIGGAKKDLWKDRGLTSTDLINMNFAEKNKYATKNFVFPKPDYQKMVDEGMPVRVAFFIKTIRDALPAKPTIDYFEKDNDELIAKKLEGYVEFISDFKDTLMKVKTEDDILSFYKNEIKDVYVAQTSSYYVEPTEKCHGNLTNKLLKACQINRYTLLDYDRKIKKKQFCYSDHDKKVDGFEIIKFDDSCEFDNDRDRTILKRQVGGSTYFYYPDNEFVDASKWQKDTYYVLYKRTIVANNLTKGQAEDVVERMGDKVLALKAEAKEGEKKARKKKFVPEQLEHIERTGPSNGIDENHLADGQMYLDTFGFAGGEFGNWMNEKDRQASLNFGYDAFMDLADALEIEPEDISLGGELSIAFGSRGSAGAVAHYEPLRQVINLTKMHGAGSLAHEWGHALDNILSKKVKGSGVDTWLTDTKSNFPSAMPELVDAMLYRTATDQLDIDDATGELNLDEIISQSQMEQNERKCLDKIAEDEAEMHENHIDVKAELNSKEEAFLIAKLGKEGFSVPQQRLLLGLFRKGSGMDEDTIMYYFSPDMSIEDMQDYIDVMSA